jgi:hypothetical protein
VEEIVAPQAITLYAGADAMHGKSFHQILPHIDNRVVLAYDKASVAKLVPPNLILLRELVGVGHYDEDSFPP